MIYWAPGLASRPWSTLWRGESPAFFIWLGAPMPELGIFVDESGDFGSRSDYYVLTLVFHDQAQPIDGELSHLTARLQSAGLPPGHAVHAGHIVRREGEFSTWPLSVRRAIAGRLLAFTRRCGVQYHSTCVRKREYPDRLRLKTRLARELALFFRAHMEYFFSFDRVIVYYDNGQAPVTELIGTVLGSIFFDVDFRKVAPSDYRLFQSADLICTLELAAVKADEGHLSRSEEIFFESRRKLRKNWLAGLEKLRLK